MIGLELPSPLRARIEAEARATYPRECCGLIEGRRDGARVVATALHPARNLCDDPERFAIDPTDHFAALHAARVRGTTIVGCYHSHPNGLPEPSARDHAGAGETGFVWVIAATDADGAVALRCYAFDGDGFSVLTLGTADVT